MKKSLIILLSLVCLVILFGCGNNAESNSTISSSSGVSNDDLINAVNLIKSAEDCVVNVSTVQLDNWSTASYSTSLYFEDSAYLEEFGPSGPSDYFFYPTITAYTNRATAKSNLDKAKKILGSSGVGDFYEATKSYYKEVSSFFALVSTFPEGYSLLTFSNAVKDYKSRCSSAYEDARFYIE
ncbi:MAG: hypothetical protein IJU94_06305 [Clostridia bacterium]|nr:hypothetical protein [Clostridia bacterium]